MSNRKIKISTSNTGLFFIIVFVTIEIIFLVSLGIISLF